MVEALGLIETRGFVSAIESLVSERMDASSPDDAIVKSRPLFDVMDPAGTFDSTPPP